MTLSESHSKQGILISKILLALISNASDKEKLDSIKTVLYHDLFNNIKSRIDEDK